MANTVTTIHFNLLDILKRLSKIWQIPDFKQQAHISNSSWWFLHLFLNSWTKKSREKEKHEKFSHNKVTIWLKHRPLLRYVIA